TTTTPCERRGETAGVFASTRGSSEATPIVSAPPAPQISVSPRPTAIWSAPPPSTSTLTGWASVAGAGTGVPPRYGVVVKVSPPSPDTQSFAPPVVILSLPAPPATTAAGPLNPSWVVISSLPPPAAMNVGPVPVWILSPTPS